MSSVVLSGDTSGTVTVQVPAVAGTNTVTIAAQTGTLNAAGPAFSAYLGTNQSISANTYTKLQINTEEFDTNNNYDSTTNYRFTPTVAGYYMFTFNAEGTALARTTAYLYKNGSLFKQGADSIGNGINGNSSNGACLVYANGSTDYFELYVQGNNSNTINSGSSITYFQASLVRGA